MSQRKTEAAEESRLRDGPSDESVGEDEADEGAAHDAQEAPAPPSALWSWLARYNKVFYYSLMAILPLIYWTYTVWNYGGIEYYYPERIHYNIDDTKRNVFVLLRYKDEFLWADHVRVKRVLHYFCWKDDEWDEFNVNFFALADIPYLETNLYFVDREPGFSFEQVLDLEFLDRFQYGFVMNIGDTDASRPFCQEVIRESVAFQNPEGKFTNRFAGGRMAFFKSMLNFLKDFDGAEAGLHDETWWSKGLTEFFTENEPKLLLTYDFLLDPPED